MLQKGFKVSYNVRLNMSRSMTGALIPHGNWLMLTNLGFCNRPMLEATARANSKGKVVVVSPRPSAIQSESERVYQVSCLLVILSFSLAW